MSDVNKVWLSGTATTQPVFSRVGGKTPITYFTLQVNEQFKNRQGELQVKANPIRIESLGKSAEPTSSKVKLGRRYTVEGYIRCNEHGDRSVFCVRTFAIYEDTTVEGVTFNEAMKQALKVVRTSRDKNAAIQKLEELVK